MIKYRVWDTVAKEYLDESAVSINGHGGLAVFDGANIPVATQLPGSTSPRFIIEQYTGLKDKNGAEIAVGDVVRARGYSGYDNYSIVYSEHHASFNMRRTDTPKWMRISEAIGRPHTGDMEVIGNIHENAELLEAKDE